MVIEHTPGEILAVLDVFVELIVVFTTGYSKLDPTRGDDGHYTSEYRLLLNITEDELREAGAG